MSGPDQLERLEGAAEIPSLTPRRSGSNLKPVLAGGVLILSLVGVLGFAGSRFLAKKEAPAEVTADVASATAIKLRFQEPAGLAQPPAEMPTPVASDGVKAIALNNQTRVPSIEATGTEPGPVYAIPVRGSPSAVSTATSGSTVGGRPQKYLVPIGDESPFGASSNPSTHQSGATELPMVGGPSSSTASGLAGEAQANLRRYQNQLGGMLGQLQNLTDKAAGSGSPSAALEPVLSSPNAIPMVARQSTPALFGSMERTATPLAVAGLLGNRSLTLPRGVLFTCALKTRIISATSGFVACLVQRNVFSDDGRVVLAERGSHLDGEYRVVQVRPGVTRIPVLWTRLRTPHGVTVELDSPGTGALGESGVGGFVDNRWGERIGAALLVSLIDDAIKLVASDASSATGNASGNATVLLPSTAAAGSRLAEKVLEATINIPPLIYQNQGGVVGVYVARDVDFSKVYALEPR